MRAMLPVLVTAVAFLALGASPLQAAVTSYTSGSAFVGAMNGATLTVEGFESLNGAPAVADTTIPSGALANGLSYRFPTDTLGRVDQGYAHFDGFGLSLSRLLDADYFYNNEQVSIALPGLVRAVGVYFNALETTPSTFHLSAAGAKVGNAATYDTGTFYFVGLVSDDPFDQLVLGAEANSSGWTIDNLMFGTPAAPVAVTPIPAGVATLPLGLLALGYLRRRARRRDV